MTLTEQNGHEQEILTEIQEKEKNFHGLYAKFKKARTKEQKKRYLEELLTLSQKQMDLLHQLE
jgi:hypothetical protein